MSVDTKFTAELIVKVLEYYLPYRCPACGEQVSDNSNDRGVCDSCFAREAHQRAVHSLTLEDGYKFADWYQEHYRGEE